MAERRHRAASAPGLGAAEREDSGGPYTACTRETRPGHSGGSRLAAGERGAVTVGGLDPPSPPRPPSAGRAQPPASPSGGGERARRASVNRRRQWARALPAAPAPHRIPGARVAFPQAAEAAPARPRFHPGSGALLSGRGGGGEGRALPAAAAGGLLREPEGTRITKEKGFLWCSPGITFNIRPGCPLHCGMSMDIYQFMVLRQLY
ncbi:translation initiation factor IF-2-like [Mesocricetus auratus]|uniref:Translation initiation factor IF-2-like n=1 Tax=Mesocricetus auratus TaxID=10036 RepID=A0ABM2Y8M5_MESAU|nr:translation initiation factor IF-2-like [Mesocricetus auratus]